MSPQTITGDTEMTSITTSFPARTTGGPSCECEITSLVQHPGYGDQVCTFENLVKVVNLYLEFLFAI